VAVFLTASHATASSDSLWVNSGTMAKTVLAENITYPGPHYDKNCTRETMQELAYKYNGTKWISNGYAPVTGNCWTQTGFGLYGSGSAGQYIRFGDAGTITNVDVTRQLIPVGDGLAYRYNNGSSFFWGLYIYENPARQFYLQSAAQVGGTRDRYTFAYDNPPPAWRLNDPQTGSELYINAYGVSNNRDWMAIETSRSFIRLNVETKEILAFENPLWQYGYGLNPSYELAISNDGRYAIISGGDIYTRITNIYDLATCTPIPNKPIDASTGCGKRGLKTALFSNASQGANFGNIMFDNSGENISFNFSENGKTNRYTVTAPGKNQHGLEYLALGDSFSSGEGDNDGGRYYAAGTDGNGESINNTGITNFPYWKEKCHLSTRSYPYLLAATANLSGSQFRSIACSGSLLRDVTNTNNSGSGTYAGRFDQFLDYRADEVHLRNIKSNALAKFIPGRAAQLEFVQKYKPRAVTIGIGGNDIDFGKKLSECLLPGTCRYAGADKKYTAIEISLLYDNLVRAYTQLKSTSPTTRFYAIGYPQLFTSGGECQKNVFFNAAEQEYATYVVNYLNHTIAAAAAKAGINYLRIEDSLAGNNLCSSANNLAVNGLEIGSDKSILGHESQYFGVFGAESYHPNNIGHSLIANALQAAMSYSPVNIFNTCFPGIGLSCDTANSNKPAPPAYFGLGSSFSPVVRGGIQIENNNSEASNDSIQKGTEVLVNMSGEEVLKPGSIASFTLHSNPVNLGYATVDAQGKISANLAIPADTPVGYHTLHMIGTTPAGDSVDYYQSIFVYANVNDLDGDGIPNTEDTCGFVEPSNIDADSDGIDDACDGFIGEVETHPLYRVRSGVTDKGEIAGRFYIERDILEAKSKLNIVNDADPDGDGWALVGHTESDNDGKTQTRFWVDDAKLPHLLLNGENSITCAQLTPASLAVVAQNEDRLLRTEQGNSCPDPEPMQAPEHVVPTPDVGDSSLPVAGSVDNNDPTGNDMVNPQTTVFPEDVRLVAASPHQQMAIHMPDVDQTPQILDTGHVAGVSTAKMPTYFDGPGKNSADVANQVSNTFLIGGSVMCAVLLGIVLLVRSVSLFDE
jgi:lysophospholipase L1-like esterase